MLQTHFDITHDRPEDGNSFLFSFNRDEEPYRAAVEAQAFNNLEPNNHLTYGEITYGGFLLLLDSLVLSSLPNSAGKAPTFFDLGSGAGKGVICAALSGHFRSSTGIEVVPSLHEIAARSFTRHRIEAGILGKKNKKNNKNNKINNMKRGEKINPKLKLAAIKKTSNNINKTNAAVIVLPSLVLDRPSSTVVELYQASLFDPDMVRRWREGDYIYVASLKFGKPLQVRLGETARLLKKGAIFIILHRLEQAGDEDFFVLVKKEFYTVSWSLAFFYVYRRL